MHHGHWLSSRCIALSLFTAGTTFALLQPLTAASQAYAYSSSSSNSSMTLDFGGGRPGTCRQSSRSINGRLNGSVVCSVTEANGRHYPVLVVNRPASSIHVTGSSTNGWMDIRITDAETGQSHLYRWNGRAYDMSD